jgi:aminoglycoside 6'-N-acetyltransferase I
MHDSRENRPVSVVRADASRLDALAELACKLWPDNEPEAMRAEFEDMLDSDRHVVFVAEADGGAIGFVHMSLRFDYVEGSASSPVGYVEGVYVEEPYRHGGVARKLIEAGEGWAKSRGCRELASDAELDNVHSQKFHLKIGFREANRIVAFIKDIT